MIKLPLLSIPLFSTSGISSWVVYQRFVPDSNFIFFKRTILLIHHQFLQFWYQCIKNTSIYRIIGNFPPNCYHTKRKTDKVFDLLQSANLTYVDDFWTWTIRSISQSSSANLVRHNSPTLFDILLNRRGFPFSGFKGHPRRVTLRIGVNWRLCPFFVWCGTNLGGHDR